QGMRLTSAIAAVVATAVAVFAVITLRHVGSGSDREAAVDADPGRAAQGTAVVDVSAEAVPVDC
ncbi:MAG: hypothetical protein ACRDHU_13205, partial [Actinomycetota bacterium]